MFWLEEWKTKQKIHPRTRKLAHMLSKGWSKCVHSSMFLKTGKFFKTQNACNLYKALACYSTELFTKVSGVRTITEEAQKLYWL